METLIIYTIASYFIILGSLVDCKKIRTGHVMSFIFSPFTVLLLIGMKLNK